jgi:23S rRNA (cytosine1962-C5)-methyltransferase
MTNLRINRRAADRLRAGHLWIYRSDLEADPIAPPGALLTVTDARAASLGTALYSTTSQIAARLVSPTPDLTREAYLSDVRERVLAAVARRRLLAPITESNSAHRLLFSEADNLPGILADRYNNLVLLQLLTQGTAQQDVRDTIVAALRESLSPNNEPLTIWERPDPRIRELENLPVPPDAALFTTGDTATTTTFLLNGLRFTYDATAGQKTGAFLDQRLNYAAAAAAVSASTHTHRALDVCTYQGGFALHLAQVCERVTGVDASHAALVAADHNLTLNPHLNAQTDWIEADAFELLRAFDTQRERFDAIVLDPPAFAKSKRAAEGALRGYKELNLRALRMIAPGGTLITNSCSHHVSLQDFTAIVASAAADAGRRVQLLETRAAAPDHPEVLTLPETQYLKCLICRVD